MNIYIYSHSEAKIPNSNDWLSKHQYNLIYHSSDKEANLHFSNKKPDVILSVGTKDSDFPTLCALPLYIRKRWTRVLKIDEITPTLIESYFIGAYSQRLAPTITIFTSTYKSGDKIMRPFNTIRAQTYAEWEWIIMDDSPEESEEEVWKRIKASYDSSKVVKEVEKKVREVEKIKTEDKKVQEGQVKEEETQLWDWVKFLAKTNSTWNLIKICVEKGQVWDKVKLLAGVEEKIGTIPKIADTWERIKSLAEQDCRIRVFRQKGNDGYIGSVKHCTASMARGKYILEMDHDDELLPKALEIVVDTFDAQPDVDMVASDFSEIYEDTLANFSYGEYFGKGRHCYYRQFYNGRWVNVARNGPLDKFSLNHIVGVVNHLRAWRVSTYAKMRGHDFNLNVVDDYELILRTFLEGKIARIPEFLYIQYRNQGGNNFTFIRLDLIQKLVRIISNVYADRIRERCRELDLPYFDPGCDNEKYGKPPNIYLSCVPDPTADVVLDPCPNRVTIVMPTCDEQQGLVRAVQSILDQDFKDWVLYIIGDKCPTLEQSMEMDRMHDPRIRYWNIGEKRGLETCRNYALKILASTKYIAYLDANKWWYSYHLGSMYRAINEREDIGYVLGSFKNNDYTITCREPRKGRVEQGALLHKKELLDKYGYWQSPKVVGEATNFELVSRWMAAGIRYGVTKIPSLHYETSEMKAIYEMYDDQRE